MQRTDCNNVMTDTDNWHRIDDERTKIETVAIGTLPIKDFVSATEAAKVLGTTRQALHKNRGISAEKIIAYHRQRRVEYYIRSVEQFKKRAQGDSISAQSETMSLLKAKSLRQGLRVKIESSTQGQLDLGHCVFSSDPIRSQQPAVMV
jgi:hypothetical protein